jgi:hypothetical protein
MPELSAKPPIPDELTDEELESWLESFPVD